MAAHLSTTKTGARRNSAFTLMELLVVTLIIGLLAALLLPALSQARGMARKASCASNERQLGLAYLMYLGDYGECFPPYYAAPAPYPGFSTLGTYFKRNARLLQCPSDRTPQKEISYYTNEYLADWAFGGPPTEVAVRLSVISKPDKVALLREIHTGPVTDSGYTVNRLDSWCYARGFYNHDETSIGGADWSAARKAHLRGSNMLFIDGGVRHYGGDHYSGGSLVHTLDFYNISALPDY